MTRWTLIHRIAIVAGFALAIYAGCQTGTPSGLNAPSPEVTTVGAGLPEVPMEFAPGAPAERTSLIDVSGELPRENATDAALGFDAADLAITVRPESAAKVAGKRRLTITLAIAEGTNAAPCSSGVGAGRFVVDVAGDGGVLGITPERPRLGEIVATALRLGDVSLCTRVEADFAGSILIRQAKVDVAFNGGDLQGTDDNTNSNTGDDQSNDNVGDNTNSNTAGDNKNDNTDDVGDNKNDNTGDNKNDNVGDNKNGNTDDNTNGNTDDNANDNTDDNANDNTDDNANDNTDDNANDNTDDNANDNTDDNSNGNGNTNDNANDNTSDAGLCGDGWTRLEGELDSSVELEAEYRLHAAGCARFRVKVRSYVAGSYSILVNGSAVGTISVGGDGRGEGELDTDDGTFPSDFPLMALDDVVTVGSYSVTMGDDCSSDDIDTCLGNGNSNSNDNSNTNG